MVNDTFELHVAVHGLFDIDADTPDGSDDVIAKDTGLCVPETAVAVTLPFAYTVPDPKVEVTVPPFDSE